MKQRTVAGVLMAVGFAVNAVADDAPSDKPIQTHRQLMKQCMAEQKAKSSTTAPADLKKLCEERVKSYQDHPSAPTPDKAPSP